MLVRAEMNGTWHVVDSMEWRIVEGRKPDYRWLYVQTYCGEDLLCGSKWFETLDEAEPDDGRPICAECVDGELGLLRSVGA